MTKTQRVKQKADRMLGDALESLFEEIDIDKLKSEVEELRAAAPEFDPAEHAEVLTRRTAIRCAAAGALTGLPGGSLAIATLGADVAYLIYQQFRLALGIATIYGFEPSTKERFQEAMSCIAYGSGVGIGKQIGGRVLRESFGKLLPVVGAVSGGVLNYVAVIAVGKATTRYYEEQIDPVLAEEIWEEGDREHA